VEGPTPRPPNRSALLLRAIDRDRALLRRAQLALAALAVLIAVPIGVLAGASRAAATPEITTTLAELLHAAAPAEAAVAGELVPVTARWSGPDGEPRRGTLHAPAGLPAGAAVPVALDGDGAVVEPPAPVAGPVATGVVAATATLVVCWSALAVAGAVWRARLTARAQRGLAREWARVEPIWSERRA